MFIVNEIFRYIITLNVDIIQHENLLNFIEKKGLIKRTLQTHNLYLKISINMYTTNIQKIMIFGIINVKKNQLKYRRHVNFIMLWWDHESSKVTIIKRVFGRYCTRRTGNAASRE